MKQTGMLVVSLRGVNFGFWSRLGCSGQSANILSRQGLVQGFAKNHRITRRETEVKFSFFFFFSFLSGLFQGSKFPTSFPVCSIQESSPGVKAIDNACILRNVENTRLRLVFSTFLSCSQMSVVFYHSAIHGLGFFIC